MIDWAAFLLVAGVALVGASVVVTVAAVGIRLYEKGSSLGRSNPRNGRVSRVLARCLFGVCGLVVIFGVFLIVPVFHQAG